MITLNVYQIHEPLLAFGRRIGAHIGCTVSASDVDWICRLDDRGSVVDHGEIRLRHALLPVSADEVVEVAYLYLPRGGWWVADDGRLVHRAEALS